MKLCKICDKPLTRIQLCNNGKYCSRVCMWNDPEYIENQKETHTGEKNHFYGKKHTEEAKKKWSEAKKGEKNPMFGKHTQYPRDKWTKKGLEVLGHPVRLSWEFKFAKFLQDNSITYSYEPKAFPMVIEGKKATYIPDFYIPEQDNGGLWILPFPPDSYVEIKGYMREDAQKKIDCFRVRYPKNRLVLLDKNAIKKIIRI